MGPSQLAVCPFAKSEQFLPAGETGQMIRPSRDLGHLALIITAAVYQQGQTPLHGQQTLLIQQVSRVTLQHNQHTILPLQPPRLHF